MSVNLSSNFKNKAASSKLEKLSGTVERVTFHSEESGFCVLRVIVKGQKDLLTVVGNCATISPGELIEGVGTWINDREYGLQFKAEKLESIAPSTKEGIQKYLGSGIVKGIGPHFAKKLVKAFGEKVFDVIEQEPERLLELEGIGETRKNRVVESWDEQKSIRDIMVFLQSYGVGTARAVRIYKAYKDKAVEMVRENPYRLSTDIHGIGFKTADELAQKLGIPKDSILRAKAGIRHVLNQLCDKGHCAAELEDLLQKSADILEIEQQILENAIQEELDSESIIAEYINDKECVYPVSLYKSELSVAKQINNLKNGNIPWGKIDKDKAIDWVQEKTKLNLSDSQVEAVKSVLDNKVNIITGGPGVGKTTVVNSILKIIRAKQVKVGLCAPTGRAAKRLSETTRLQAKTIHRMLEFDPKTFSFRKNQDSPLNVDLLVVDEASMLDIVMTNNLLKAIPKHAALLLVGDVDQLPSVGPGKVLEDIIDSKIVSVVRLTKIFRQAAQSKIIVNAHRINEGKMPVVPEESEKSDFYAIYADDAEEVHAKLLRVVSNRIPKFIDCNPIQDIQILTPMNRGKLGARSLNLDMQQILNSNAKRNSPSISKFGWVFMVGDKVIQTVNNYDKDVFNGDIGIIKSIDMEENIVNIDFDGRIMEYDYNELDEINLAYAISIHKSQGSEYPIVVIPVSTQHFTMLARNLIYTGVTRGKKLVVLVGQKKALFMAIRNINQDERITDLKSKLGE